MTEQPTSAPGPTDPRRPSRWREIGVLYRREARAALRERNIVVNSILMPVFLYPFVLWVFFTGLTFVMGQTEGHVARVLFTGWPKEHAQLWQRLQKDERFRLLAPEKAIRDPQAAIRRGDLEALVEFLPPRKEDAALPGNFAVRVTYNQSKERSDAARERLSAILARYKDDWLVREAAARGIDSAAWQVFALESRNTASGREMGTFLMGLVIPAYFVLMVVFGCFHPAVDATAGERERNTWETLLSTAASRSNVVISKYLYVTSFGCLAGLLNLAAMSATLKPILAPLLSRSGEEMAFAVPLVAIPLLFLAALLLAGFIAAGMMVFAVFARTFKEGQAMITPFYMLVLLPALFANAPGIEFTLPLALVPVVNVMMMVRETMAGVFHWPQIGLTLLATSAFVLLCLRLATFILRFEDVIVGSHNGSLTKLLKERILKRSRAGGRSPEAER